MQLQPKSNEGLIKQLKKDCLTRTQLLVWVQQLNFTAEQEIQLEKLVSKIIEDKLEQALTTKDTEIVAAVSVAKHNGYAFAVKHFRERLEIDQTFDAAVASMEAIVKKALPTEDNN